MILAEVHDTTIQVAIITTLGLVIVAIIGRSTQKSTSKAKSEAQNNAEEASKSAEVAKDYAAAVAGKDALLQSMNERLKFVEQHDENCTKRLEELERRSIEDEEAKRSASLLEREFRELQEEVEKLRQRK